jgi:hypothetical protein
VLNKEKYLATMNLGLQDDNKLGWKIGDEFHTSSGFGMANRYEYCGYKEIEVPRETRVRLTGVKQTELNASFHDGIGDVYVDFECVDLKNEDGTPVTCGNRHAWSLLEASPDHMVCPDGSGDLGMVSSGEWRSYAGEYEAELDHLGQRVYVRNKTIKLDEVV